MSLPVLLQWPDELANQAWPLTSDRWDPYAIAAYVRMGWPQRVEPHLLARLAEYPQDRCFVLTHLALCADLSGHGQRHRQLLHQLADQYPDQDMTRWLQLRHWIATLDHASIQKAGVQLWAGESQSPFLRLMRCRYELTARRFDQAQACLEALPSQLASTLEVSQIRGDLAFAQGQHKQALAIWLPLLLRAPRCRRTLQRAVDLAIECRYSDGLIAAIRRGMDHFGEHPDFLNQVGSIKLYQRQPGLARRAILLGKVWQSLGLCTMDLANQLSSYEMNGLVDWIDCLPDSVAISHLQQQTLHSNLCMQLASLESPNYQSHLNTYLAALGRTQQAASYREAGSPPQLRFSGATNERLTIAWVTGDLAPHPVSRFLLQFFTASDAEFSHRHQLVSTFDHGLETCQPWFESLKNLELVDVSQAQNESKVAAIRALQADVAIDLSGWTSHNFLAGFLARLAPIQVNYLGYFASSGIPAMDYWLGDSALFPDPMQEYHSESIFRLSRPFLAWQPCDPLPEASAEIEPGPTQQIRFGSFNHNRKLSDRTLKLWGRILQLLPQSRLVLKANASDDLHTQILLRRRMQRCGLDPERVEWLDLTKGPREHLRQYRFLDVALDPVPNGGCTTTCEALWMGVPVITLQGRGYVSRMSTAVQTGAGLAHWVAKSEQGYVQLALQAAQQLSALRQGRDQWRRCLQASPLGDAADLMRHLESAFSEMVRLQCSSSSSSAASR